MGEDPDRIRQEIERTRREYSENAEADRIRDEIDATRSEMGETTEALGHKADVKSRVKESISEKKDSVVGSVSRGKDAVVGSADSLVSRVGGAVPDTQQVKEGARKVGIARENPLGVAIGGAAVGFLAGLVVPSTRMEDERIGDMADQVKDTVKDTGQEALERGKQVAQEAVSSAQEAAKDSGGQQTQELASSLKDSAREVASTSGNPREGA
jgi:gas vesicle protein